MTRRPADPEEELRWMSQEVRGYVEAVLNSLAANVPKVGQLFSLPIFNTTVIFSPFSPFITCAGSCPLPSRES